MVNDITSIFGMATILSLILHAIVVNYAGYEFNLFIMLSGALTTSIILGIVKKIVQR